MPLVAARELRSRNHMILYSSFHLVAGGALAQADRGHIQGIEREAVAVCKVARRRARAGVAWLLEIIDPIQPNQRLPGIERLHHLGYVEEHSMGEDALRRGGVL